MSLEKLCHWSSWENMLYRTHQMIMLGCLLRCVSSLQKVWKHDEAVQQTLRSSSTDMLFIEKNERRQTLSNFNTHNTLLYFLKNIGTLMLYTLFQTSTFCPIIQFLETIKYLWLLIFEPDFWIFICQKIKGRKLKLKGWNNQKYRFGRKIGRA